MQGGEITIAHRDAQQEGFRRGDAHPSGDGRVFNRYKRHRLKSGLIKVYEEWTTPEKAAKANARVRAWYKANKTHHLERVAEWRSKNKDRCRDLEKRWRERNPERCQKTQAEYYQRNKQKCDQAAIKWREENPERAREISRKCYAKSPEKSRAHVAQYRARKRGAETSSHSTKVEAHLRRQARRLSKTFGRAFHLDHITPIARGGKHHHTNLSVVPARLNLIKAARLNNECPTGVAAALNLWSGLHGA